MSTARLTGSACSTDENRDLPWISENVSPLARARMARVCASCPVLAACALEVATTETTAGFWAGHDRTTPDLPEQLALPGLDVPASARVAA
jgi:hypothetical protein